MWPSSKKLCTHRDRCMDWMIFFFDFNRFRYYSITNINYTLSNVFFIYKWLSSWKNWYRFLLIIISLSTRTEANDLWRFHSKCVSFYFVWMCCVVIFFTLFTSSFASPAELLFIYIFTQLRQFCMHLRNFHSKWL